MADDARTKPSWPRLADGTTDWEAVFEDPKTGVIAIVSRAKNPEALKQSTILVIKKLFTRDDDAQEVTRFVNELDQITAGVSGDEGFAQLVASVQGLLRDIKKERQEKAREYLENLKKGKVTAKGERRTRRKKNTPAAKIYRALLAASEPKIAIPAITVILVLVVGTVFVFSRPAPPAGEQTVSGQEGAPTATVEQTPPAEETATEPEVKLDLIPEPPAGEQPAPGEGQESKSSWPRPVLLQPMHWPVVKRAGTDKSVSYSTLLYVGGASSVSTLCLNYPAVKESILMAFGRAGLGFEQPDESQRKQIADLATRIINRRLGNAVEYMEIYAHGEKGYRATNTPPCRLAR